MPGTPESRDAIEREMEQTRERLAGTIDQLLYRASPKTIANRQVAAVKGYFVAPDGSMRTDHVIRVVGGVVGTITALVVIRRLLS